MKLVIAIIRPEKLEEVKNALADQEIYRMTVSDCQGFGRQKGHTEVYRGQEYQVNLLRKIMLEIAVDDEFLDATIEAIARAGRSQSDGRIGDGKIFVLPLEDAVRIRTGERGPEAI